MCVCVRACVRACVCARACVRVCARQRCQQQCWECVPWVTSDCALCFPIYLKLLSCAVLQSWVPDTAYATQHVLISFAFPLSFIRYLCAPVLCITAVLEPSSASMADPALVSYWRLHGRRSLWIFDFDSLMQAQCRRAL